MPKTLTHKRVNITLPENTIRLIDKVAEKGGRSKFLDTAVHFYMREANRTNMRRLLREGAVARAERDLGLVEEWFPVEYSATPKKE